MATLFGHSPSDLPMKVPQFPICDFHSKSDLPTHAHYARHLQHCPTIQSLICTQGETGRWLSSERSVPNTTMGSRHHGVASKNK